MKFGFFGDKKSQHNRRRGADRRSSVRGIEQLEDRRMLANTPPNLATIPPATATTGTELVIQLNVSDTETTEAAQLFAFFDPDEAPAVNGTPVTNAIINNATKEFRWTPTAQQVGTFRFVVLVTDREAMGSAALADAEEFTVTVEAVNQPPTNTVPGTQTVAEDADLVFSTAGTNRIAVADPDAGNADVQVTFFAGANGTLTLSTIANLTFTDGDGTADATMTFTGSIAEINAALEGLRFEPNADFSGAASITMTTSDLGNTGPGGALMDIDTVAINVTAVADTPAVSLATTQENTQTTAGLVITRNAEDGDEVTHVKITGITNGTLFLNDGVTAVNNGGFITFAQGQAGLRYTPATDFVGTASFGVQASTSATDAGLGGQVATALITVFPANDGPDLAEITDKTVARGEELMFTATATDTDAGDTLTFAIDPDMADLGATINPATGEFRWTPGAAQPDGPVTFRILVVDSGEPALGDSETFVVTVTGGNAAPSLEPIGDQTIAEGSALTLTAAATDPDAGDELSYSLEAGQFPEGAAINSQSGVFEWTPSESQGPGDYPVTIVVTDDGTPALTHSESFTITVTEVNQPPSLAEIGDRNGTVGTAVTFNASATDPDSPANQFAFSLVGAPAGAAIDAETGAFTWMPGAAGEFTFSVRVTDNGNPALTDEEEITITVAASNQAPVLDAIADPTGTVGNAVTFTADATDADGDDLIFSLVGAPDGATINPSTGAFTWTPDAAGEFTFAVVVTDDGTPAQSDQQDVTITVS